MAKLREKNVICKGKNCFKIISGNSSGKKNITGYCRKCFQKNKKEENLKYQKEYRENKIEKKKNNIKDN